MPKTYPLLPDDQITHRDALPAMKRTAEAQGRHLADWPLNDTNPRLIVVRSYKTADRCEESRALAYLGLPAPPSDP